MFMKYLYSRSVVAPHHAAPQPKPPPRVCHPLRSKHYSIRTGSGSGLGLAIVRAIAVARGGGVRLVDGLEGHGLGVEVRRPWHRASHTSDTPASR